MIDILPELKLIFSMSIATEIPKEKQTYFYDLINSIPDDLFSSTNPFKLQKAGKKLSGFLSSLIDEMVASGADKQKLEAQIEEMNHKYIEGMVGKRVSKALLRKVLK